MLKIGVSYSIEDAPLIYALFVNFSRHDNGYIKTLRKKCSYYYSRHTPQRFAKTMNFRIWRNSGPFSRVLTVSSVVSSIVCETLTCVITECLGVFARTLEKEMEPLAAECVNLGLALMADATDPDLRRCMWVLGSLFSIVTQACVAISTYEISCMIYISRKLHI